MTPPLRNPNQPIRYTFDDFSIEDRNRNDLFDPGIDAASEKGKPVDPAQAEKRMKEILKPIGNGNVTKIDLREAQAYLFFLKSILEGAKAGEFESVQSQVEGLRASAAALSKPVDEKWLEAQVREAAKKSIPRLLNQADVYASNFVGLKGVQATLRKAEAMQTILRDKYQIEAPLDRKRMTEILLKAYSQDHLVAAQEIYVATMKGNFEEVERLVSEWKMAQYERKKSFPSEPELQFPFQISSMISESFRIGLPFRISAIKEQAKMGHAVEVELLLKDLRKFVASNNAFYGLNLKIDSSSLEWIRSCLATGTCI